MLLFFFFNHTATTEIYTLSLHDALPISRMPESIPAPLIIDTLKDTFREARQALAAEAQEPSRHQHLGWVLSVPDTHQKRSEEHTSELQSHSDLVCRLLLEKKKKTRQRNT